jgi:predicted amidophosphoribosyltransferase
VWLSGVRVWAPVAYSGPARRLVGALKFGGARGVADAMAAQIVANAPSALLTQAPSESLVGSTLVPVPLHPRRLRSRGYNQAAAIAEALGRRAGLEVVDCLARTGPALTQVGRDRVERRAGPAGEIRVREEPARSRRRQEPAPAVPQRQEPAPAVPRRQESAPAVPRRVLLVDDVVTTGATLAACRASLVASGVVEVAAVAFARTLGR